MATQQPPHPGDGADPEQEKWLDDAAENVRKQAFFMKRALDSGDVREALRCASLMASELRLGTLSPKNYYELYMDVTNELRELELYFDEEQKNPQGVSVVELYETVQHTGNIIPRLYLLITVASVYIKTKKAPARDILFDLVELCRGVQHPMRGLFLRNYLSQISKDKLPDVGSQYEGAGGTVKDAIEFILQNFGEMNKLWVRMQHQGAVRDRGKREQERRNLRQLVGTNLVRLSEMEGVDLETYKSIVLPRMMEQIVNCKDQIAQEYLMEVVIQVFADEYHLQTLETFLATCAQLQKSVNVKNIIIAMMNRLANYAKERGAGIRDKVDMFRIFLFHTSEVIKNNPKIPMEDILQLQVALVNFASSVYPERIDYVDHVLGFSVQVLEKTGNPKVDPGCVKYVTQLLTLPIQSLLLSILELNSFAALMAFLAFDTRKQVAISIVEAVLEKDTPLDNPDKLEKLFSFISPLIKDQEDSRPFSDDEKFQFDIEQTLVARLFHLIKHADTDVQFALYAAARKYFGQGGERRIEYTLPPLVFGSLSLARYVFQREEKKDDGNPPVVKARKVFGFVHEIVSALTAHFPELAFRLFLQSAIAADAVGYEAIAYEFVAQAFIVYEEEISDSRAQFVAINLIISTLLQMMSFGQENYDALVTKATQHSAKLLQKPDQCRAVYNCAHLFWMGADDRPGHRDERRVLECLQRSLKIANGCVGHQVHLFVEILNKYLYFFDRNCPSITVKYLKGLIQLIEEHLPNLDNSDISQLARRHYQNTLAHIKNKQALDDDLGKRYRQISEAE